jgi:hypothetical protein
MRPAATLAQRGRRQPKWRDTAAAAVQKASAPVKRRVSLTGFVTLDWFLDQTASDDI